MIGAPTASSPERADPAGQRHFGRGLLWLQQLKLDLVVGFRASRPVLTNDLDEIVEERWTSTSLGVGESTPHAGTV